jgi:MerR family regulatory protein
MDLLPIGQFARMTGLTVRAVRHYGELGLLEPAYVDPDTGYRYFTTEQVADAERSAVSASSSSRSTRSARSSRRTTQR